MYGIHLEPGEVFELRDSLAAEIWMEKLGLLSAMPKNPGDGPWMAMAVDMQHPTHALVATHVSGFPERKDGGYTLMCFPKSKFTAEDVAIYINLFKNNGNVQVAGWHDGWS